MRFELTSTIINQEVKISDSEYSATILLYIKEVNNKIPVFIKDILVLSNNSQTGYEVDHQRQLAIDDYINSINI